MLKNKSIDYVFGMITGASLILKVYVKATLSKFEYESNK